MEMLALLDKYIDKLCKASSMEKKDIENLIDEIAKVFFSEKELRSLSLEYYCPYMNNPDLLSDVRILKAKLEYEKASLSDSNEKAKLQLQAEQEKRDLEKLRLQAELSKGSIMIQNTNNNENHNTISVTFESVRDAVGNMTSLPDEDIEEIKNKIDEIEAIVNSKESKSKKWSRAKEIVKWIADKGVDVGIALLPLILKIS